jgi:ParB family chromosome partitioning protein
MARLQQLNAGMDALLAEQAQQQHRFHVARPEPSTWRPRPPEAHMTNQPSLRLLAVDQIHPGSGLRHDFPEAELGELAQSIRDNGILQPLLVRPYGNAYQLVAGARRWKAAQLAGVLEVPVIVRALDDAAAPELSLIENVQRADLSPLEEAEAYRRLLELRGGTQENLSAAIGKSRSHVANTLRLLSLPEPVRQRLGNGELSAGHARALLSAADPVALADKIFYRHLNVREAEQLVQRRARPARTTCHTRDDEAFALADSLAAALGVSASVKFRRGGGATVTLGCATRDRLDHVVGLLRAGSGPAAAAA